MCSFESSVGWVSLESTGQSNDFWWERQGHVWMLLEISRNRKHLWNLTPVRKLNKRLAMIFFACNWAFYFRIHHFRKRLFSDRTNWAIPQKGNRIESESTDPWSESQHKLWRRESLKVMRGIESVTTDWSYFVKSYMSWISSSSQTRCSFVMLFTSDEGSRRRLKSLPFRFMYARQRWHSAWVSTTKREHPLPSIESLD